MLIFSFIGGVSILLLFRFLKDKFVKVLALKLLKLYIVCGIEITDGINKSALIDICKFHVCGLIIILFAITGVSNNI